MIQLLTPAQNQHMWTVLYVTLTAPATPLSALLRPQALGSTVKSQHATINARFTRQLVEPIRVQMNWLSGRGLCHLSWVEYLKKHWNKKEGNIQALILIVVTSVLSSSSYWISTDWLRPNLIGYGVNICIIMVLAVNCLMFLLLLFSHVFTLNMLLSAFDCLMSYCI